MAITEAEIISESTKQSDLSKYERLTWVHGARWMKDQLDKELAAKDKEITRLQGILKTASFDLLRMKDLKKELVALNEKMQTVAGDAQAQHEKDAVRIKELEAAVTAKMKIMEQQRDRIKELEDTLSREVASAKLDHRCWEIDSDLLNDLQKKFRALTKERDELKAELTKSIPLSEVHDAADYIREIKELKAKIEKAKELLNRGQERFKKLGLGDHTDFKTLEKVLSSAPKAEKEAGK